MIFLFTNKTMLFISLSVFIIEPEPESDKWKEFRNGQTDKQEDKQIHVHGLSSNEIFKCKSRGTENDIEADFLLSSSTFIY